VLKKLVILLIIIACIALLPSQGQPIPVFAQSEEPIELVTQRTRTSKTYDLGNDNRKAVFFSSSIHYQNELGVWQDIDENIQPSQRANWNWEVTKGHWQLLIKDDTTIAFVKDGNRLGFKYIGIAYLDWQTKEYAILDTRANIQPQIYGNKIVWENIFYGTNLEYIYTADGFKENLVISQQARNWLSNNPPSSYGLNNATTYLGGYIECDWKDTYPAFDSDNNNVNFDSHEAITSTIFWKHPIKDYIINALPIGYAEHEDLGPSEWEKIRHRFYLHTNGKHYLLFGSKVTALNQYPSGTITIDPSITVYPDPHPETSTVDGYAGESSPDRGWDSMQAAAGDTSDDSSIHIHAYFRSNGVPNQWMDIWRGIILFDTSSIPDGETITSATLSLYGQGKLDEASNSPTFNIFSSAPASNNDLANGDYDSCGTTAYCDTAITYANIDTSGYNDWAFNATGIAAIDKTGVSKFSVREATYDAPDVQPTWGSGGAEAYADFFSAEQSGTSNDPMLVVVYGGVPPTVTTANATSVEETTATLQGNITDVGAGNATARRFEWGVFNSFTDNWTEFGNYGTGAFSHAITGLTPGVLYVNRASANNSAGWGAGDNITFLTKPNEPINLTISNQGNTWIYFQWTDGTGDNKTEVRYQTGSCPTSNTSGSPAYYGSSNSVNLTGLTSGTQYSVSGWSTATEDIWIMISDNYSCDTDYTLPGDPSNLTSSSPTCNSVNLTWTEGTGGDYNMVRYQTGSYPTSPTDGTQGYYGTDNYTTVTGLSKNTTYYFVVFARDSDSNYYSSGSSQDTETTLETNAPTVTTGNATSISDTSATLWGNITDVDCQNATLRGIRYGSACANMTDNSTAAGSFGTGVFSFPISGLSANTTYYYEAIADNDGGRGTGACANFTTSITPAALPLVPTGFTITDLGGMTSEATWNTSSSATSYLILVSRLNYPTSPTGNYEVAYSGSNTTANLTGYSLETTTYFFSLWARNASGYSTAYITAQAGGRTMALIAFVLLAMGLTSSTFIFKKTWLGMGAAAGWILLSLYGFTTSTSTWDLYYGLGWFSVALVVGSALATVFMRERGEIKEELSDEDRELEEHFAEQDKYNKTLNRFRDLNRPRGFKTRAERNLDFTARTGKLRR
jgi:hypothetical protein